METEPRPAPRGLLARGLLLLPWLLTLALAAELGMAGAGYYREQASPYVRAVLDSQPWPRSDSESVLVKLAPKADDTRLPQPAPEMQAAALAAYLHWESDAGFHQYANTYPCEAAVFVNGQRQEGKSLPRDAAGLPPKESWKDSLSAQPALTLVAAPTDTRDFRVLRFEWQGNPWHAVGFTQGDAAATVEVLYHLLPFELAPEESPYLKPYYSFKPHGVAPEGTTYFGVPEFRLNNFGFRDDDVALPRPENTYRVVCVGASTTMEGAVNGFTYPNLVERFLREAFPGRRIEVVNCGISGVNSIGERMRAPDYLQMAPNAVVIYEGVNDICHLQIPVWRKQASAALRFSLHSRVLSRATAAWLLPEPGEMRADYLAGGLGNYLAMAEYAQRCGATPVLCTFAHPDPAAMDPGEYAYYDRDARLNWVGLGLGLPDYVKAVSAWNEQVRASCAEKNLRLIDVAAQLTGGGQVFGDVCHMKDYGIEHKARLVAEGLKPLVAAYFDDGAGAH